jgi:hypothetical protein
MDSSDNKSSRLALICLGLFVLLALAAWWWFRTSAPLVARTMPITNVAPANSIETIIKLRATVNPLQAVGTTRLITKDATASPQRLTELSRWLASLPSKEAVAAIQKFLDSKVDSPTGQGFRIGAHGALTSSPTLRTYLLDQLAHLDPVAAADYARVILASADSPDEWALALRNLARGDTSDNGRMLLEQKTGELLRNEAWQQNPSVGFLEAFDAAVYLGDSQLLPVLSDLLRQPDNSAVNHAAFLTMDRLVINDPATMLSALAANRDLMQGYESTRADYFARADVRDLQQRQILESYLLNPQISAAEISVFVGIFPNANYMISENLLTQTQTPDHVALVNRDAASLSAVQQWLADPRFVKMQPALQQSMLRLQEFVRQAGLQP